MNKEKNLIKNKSLINTCKRFKFRNYLNKRILKGKTFYLLKFKNTGMFIPHKHYNNSFKILPKFFFYKLDNLQVLFGIRTQLPQNFFITTVLNFIELYFYNTT